MFGTRDRNTLPFEERRKIKPPNLPYNSSNTALNVIFAIAILLHA
jgi:hypothetical protein